MRKRIRRRSMETWRGLVARQARSGLTVQAFCRQERLNAWTFYGWRSRLREGAAVSQDTPASRSTHAASAAPFIDLGALTSTSRCEIRLDLGGGVVLYLVRG